VKISSFDVYAVYDPHRVNIMTFRRIGGVPFQSMRALRFEEQRQKDQEQRLPLHFQQQRVQQYHRPQLEARPLLQRVLPQHVPQRVPQREKRPSHEAWQSGLLPLACLGGVILVAMAALFG
jgi:hypothetical protein